MMPLRTFKRVPYSITENTGYGKPYSISEWKGGNAEAVLLFITTDKTINTI